jgi:beta-ureidopropionase
MSSSSPTSTSSMIDEVRQTWQFYRDRRPDAYADLVKP